MEDLAERKGEDQLEAEHAVLDNIVWRKLDRWLLPLATGFFLFSFLDRTNIANALVAGFRQSLRLSSHQLTVALTLTYVAAIIVEIPSTLLLKQIGPNLMLPAIALLWGTVSTMQGLVKNYSDVLACRFFLGLLEGGFFPGIVLYLSFFYPRKILQIRVATFFACTSLTGAFSGLLAAAIEQMDGLGGRPGWAWIFILEGILTFVFGMVAYFLLPRSPETACFLTEDERAFVVSTLKRAGSVSENDDKDRFSWTEVVRSLTSPHVWFVGVIFFCSGSILLGLAYFEPTIVATLGYKGNHAQLMSVPPFAVAFALSLTSAIVSDRYQCRGSVVVFFSIFEMIGFVMFYASQSNHVRYASLFFSVVGAYCSPPAVIAWMANNSAPHTRRGTAIAFGFMMTQLGGVLSTWLLGSISPAPEFKTATIVFIAMSVGMVVFAVINLAYLRRENWLKAEKREMLKKEEEIEGLGDRSAWFVYSL